MAVNTDKDREDTQAREQGLEGYQEPAADSGGPLEPVEPHMVVFDGEAASIELEGDIADHQLIEEVYEHLGDREAFQVLTTEGVDGVKTLHILGDADLDSVKTVVEAHEPDPHFGLSESDIKVRQLAQRLKDGEDLPSSDLNTLLRAMF